MSNVSVYRGNIINSEAECIVNPATPNLMPGAGVNRTIFYSAGDKLYNYCMELNTTLELGQAIATPSFDAPVECIIHVLGPYWYGGYEGEAKALASCYIESLKIMMDKGYHSIAFPAISTGNGKYPVREAAEIAVFTVKNFIENHPDYDIEVYLMCYDDETLVRYRNANVAENIDILKYLKRKEIHVNTKFIKSEISLARPSLFKKELNKEQEDRLVYTVLKRIVAKKKNLMLLSNKLSKDRITLKTCDAHNGKRGPYVTLDTVENVHVEYTKKGLFKHPEAISFVIHPYAYKVQEILDDHQDDVATVNKKKKENKPVQKIEVNLEEELKNL